MLTDQQTKLVDRDVTAWKPSFYTIIPDGLQWESTTDMGKYPYVVDTGTTMMYIPPRKSCAPSYVVVLLITQSTGRGDCKSF